MSTDKRVFRCAAGAATCLVAVVSLLAAQNSLAEAAACQKTEGTSRVTCAGACPSQSLPNCYVKHRKAGSSDEWTRTGQPGVDKNLSNREYACYCDK